MNHKKRLLIDFDGVIHKYSKGWHDGSIYDVPVDGAFDKLQMLHDAGFELVIFSTRCEGVESFNAEHLKTIVPTKEENMENILNTKNYSILLWFITQRGAYKYNFIQYLWFTNVKLPALAYIDDRGIRFTNWEDTVKYFI